MIILNSTNPTWISTLTHITSSFVASIYGVNAIGWIVVQVSCDGRCDKVEVRRPTNRIRILVVYLNFVDLRMSMNS